MNTDSLMDGADAENKMQMSNRGCPVHG